jgi:hypothetical protein
MKHNYTLAKQRELELVSCLNGDLSNNTKFNQVANYINNNLGYKFNSFTHSGSIQTEPGDILGECGGEIIPIELKILQKTKITKSHGGVTGDFWKVVNPSNTGYKEFEQISGVEKQRWDIVSDTLGVKINNHKEYTQYEKQVKANSNLKSQLENLTNEYKIKYLDIVVKELKIQSPQKLLINVINSLILGYRKFKDIKKSHNGKQLLEVQVGKFESNNITLTSKIYSANNSKIISIKRNKLALEINLDKIQITFPVVHKNGYQGSGRNLSFGCMY